MKRKFFQIIFFFSFFTSFSQDTIRLYFDDNFTESPKENATILRLALIKNNHYFITDKFIDGKMINYGEYSSVNPWIEDGYCCYYKEDGTLYSSGSYINGRLIGKWIYYSDEKLDTVDYQLADNYLNLVKDTCNKNSKIQFKKDSMSEISEIKEDLLIFLDKNIHVPPRSRNLEYFEINVDFVLDTDRYIKCPVVTDNNYLDLNYEVTRVLLLYKNPYNLQIPIRMSVPVIFNESKIDDEEGLWFVEENASFMGGDLNTFNTWAKDQVQYPLEAAEKEIKGEVIIQFSVNREGTVCDIKVVQKVHTCLDNECIRVIKSSPKWKPALQDGKPVKQIFVVPFKFSLK
jgi:TonB family protein